MVKKNTLWKDKERKVYNILMKPSNMCVVMYMMIGVNRMCYRFARPFVQIFQTFFSHLFSCKINLLSIIELLRQNMLFTSDRWWMYDVYMKKKRSIATLICFMPVIHAKYHLKRKKSIFIARKNNVHKKVAQVHRYMKIEERGKFRRKKLCLHWGLNSGPLVYETSALPLSYRGLEG